MKQVLKYLNLPDVMRRADGAPVSAETWPARRAEILALLQSEMYGKLPPEPTAIREVSREALGTRADGAVRSEMVTLELSYPTGRFLSPSRSPCPRAAKRPPASSQSA